MPDLQTCPYTELSGLYGAELNSKLSLSKFMDMDLKSY